MSEEQEIFDRVITHLFNQGEQSLDCGGGCRYRGPRGLKCAVGVDIPDEMYSEDMETYGISALLKYADDWNLKFPESIPNNLDLYKQLQTLHDFGGYWLSTKSMQRGIAKWFGNYFPDLDLTYVKTLKFKDR